MQGISVLIIEDEIDLRDAIASYINLEGGFAVGVASIEQAECWLMKNTPDFLILDLNLDGEDGLEWLSSKFLDKSISVIITSARGELKDRLKGFELGVDFYLVKPVALEELEAVIKNIYQKKQQLNQQNASDWVLNSTEWTLKNKQDPTILKLTKLEERVLNCLAKKTGEVVTKTDLIIALNKSQDAYDLRSLEVLIRRLRNKIQTISGDKSKPIKTIHAIGYAFIGSIDVFE